MDFSMQHMTAFRVIGFQREFDDETAYAETPEFWGEIMSKHANVFTGNPTKGAVEQAIADNRIGEYGICIDDVGPGKFRYLIAGEYKGGDVPDGLTVYELPRGDWAIFPCVGALPQALQSVNTRIFREWLPNNPDYALSGSANVEWYGMGDTTAPDYQSAIWIPVKRK